MLNQFFFHPILARSRPSGLICDVKTPVVEDYELAKLARIRSQARMKDRRYLYLFMDEGGNFDFSANGTRFFTVTSITKERPFVAPKALADLKYELLEEGLDLDCFHASENAQAVRNRVFQIIGQHLAGCISTA